MNTIKVYTDGGARGNPGPAAIGVFIADKNEKPIKKIGEKIGFATNNVAEYKAVISALAWLGENKQKYNKETEIYFYLDSQLVYSQICGIYKIKDAKLRELMFEIREKEALINMPIKYNFIPREKNKQADLLVNLALDHKI